MIKRTILLSSLLLFISCIKIYNRKQLVNDYEINYIKGPNTDGFYYFQNNIDGEVWVHAILFFDDGYFLNIGYVPSCGSLFGKKMNDYCQNLALENSLESALKNTECVINN